MSNVAALKIALVPVVLVVILGTANGQTTVSGGIHANTTWAKANSPYIVTDDVVVFPQYTLTIEQGVTVRFNDGKMLEVRDGSLIAIGTTVDSITFTSNSANPHPESWSGILLTGGTDHSFEYCNFHYAKTAIYPDFGVVFSVVTSSLSIRNSVFRRNEIAISSNGVPLFAAEPRSISIEHCLFAGNLITAVTAGSISNCHFRGNDVGIYLEYSDLHNCVVDSNVTGGVSASDWNSIVNCQVLRNGVGIMPGLYTNGGIKNTIMRNRIEYNNIGIMLGAGNYISCNVICNDSLYDLLYVSSINTEIEDNYWCTLDSMTTGDRIYDGYDDVSLGLVDFVPFDTLACSTPTGVRYHTVDLTEPIVFPNPCVDYVMVQSTGQALKMTITITDILGRREYYAQGITNGTAKLNISELSKGVHIVELEVGGERFRQKIVKP